MFQFDRPAKGKVEPVDGLILAVLGIFGAIAIFQWCLKGFLKDLVDVIVEWRKVQRTWRSSRAVIDGQAEQQTPPSSLAAHSVDTPADVHR